MLLTIAAAVLVLGVLIFVHELGHFIAAKAVGVGVPRFSLGLGPVTPIRWRWGETEYVLSWIPFGGYVKMATAEDEDQMIGSLEGGSSEERFPPNKLFENKPLPARILVIVAGVTMNVLFAWVVYAVLAFAYGGPEPTTPAIARVDSVGLPPAARPLASLPFGTQILRINGDTMTSWTSVYEAIRNVGSNQLNFDFAGHPAIMVAVPGGDIEQRGAIIDRLFPLQEARIGSLVPGYPAVAAGIKPGDLVLATDRDTVRSWEEFVHAIETRAGDTVSILLRRQDSVLRLSVVPVSENVKDAATGGVRTSGKIGVAAPRMRYGLLASIVEGGRQTRNVAGEVWFAVKGLVTGRISPRELGGPIQIGQLSGQVVRMGIDRLFWFMAYFSVNLAVLNLLPVPVLDGGHLLFLIIEGVRRRPLSINLRLRLSQVGMVLLIGLMLFALSNDVMRMISK